MMTVMIASVEVCMYLLKFVLDLLVHRCIDVLVHAFMYGRAYLRLCVFACGDECIDALVVS